MPSVANDVDGSTPGAVRILGTEIPAASELVQHDGGALLVRNVPLLASGTWTDSAVGTPLFYPERSLEKWAANWKDKSNWSRHLGGNPRDITEKIGEVQNIRYAEGAVRGDVYYHGLNEKSRDTIHMILGAREGKITMPYVSVEHGGTEAFNPETRQMEADEIVFYGSATVNQGACRKCRLHEAPISEEPEDAAPKPPAMEREMTDKSEEYKELEAKFEELSKKFEERPEIPDHSKELEEATATIKALEARIVELEKAPAPPVTAPATEAPRELGEVETYAVVDKTNGTIRGI